MRAGQEEEFKRVEEWKEKKQEVERDKKIRYWRFNSCHKLVSVGDLPQYLRKGGREKEWRGRMQGTGRRRKENCAGNTGGGWSLEC